MKQFMIAFDQIVNTLVPPYADAWADETFSARCWRNGKISRAWNAVRAGVDAILWFDKQHCFSSYVNEYERKQLPEEYRSVSTV